MKKGWEIKKLGEVCDIYNGGTPDTTVSKFWDGENLWITPKDMGKMLNIYVDDTLRKITDEGLKNSSAKILPINSIILSSRAPIGHLAINRKPTATNQGCKGLVPKKDISTLYIFYFLSKSVELLNDLGSGTTFKEISGSKLGTVEIPIPPLPEQQSIVSILDEAFSSIEQAKENLQRNLQNAKELFQSEMNSIFTNKGEGWEEKTLGEVCLLYQGIAINAKTKHSIVEKSELPLLRIKDLKNNTVEQYIDPNNYPKNSLVNTEDIIYTRTGSLGLVFRGFYGVLHNNSFKVVPNNEITRDFLFEFLQSPAFYEKIILLSGKAAQPDITHVLFKQQIISFPKSIQTQQKIVQQLDKLSTETKRLEAMYQQKLDALEELKKSILQKAFSGELSEN